MVGKWIIGILEISVGVILAVFSVVKYLNSFSLSLIISASSPFVVGIVIGTIIVIAGIVLLRS